MKNKILWIAIIIAVAVGAFLYFRGRTEKQAGTPPVRGIEVVYTDTGFSPKNLLIKAGETVTFKNQSATGILVASAPHPTHEAYDGTTMTQHCAPGATPSFDSCKPFLSGESYSFTFTKKGSWNYHNHVNPLNFGTITVE